VSNLPFTCTEDDLREAFERYGVVSEVHAPVSSSGSKRQSLGFAFVRFVLPSDAERAVHGLNGKALLGRRVVVDFAKEESADDDEQRKKKPRTFSEKREAERKAKAGLAPNVKGSLDTHLRFDAAAKVAATRLEAATTQDVFDVRRGSETAVKLTLAEAAIQAETVDFFKERGYDLERKDDLLAGAAGPSSSSSSSKRKRQEKEEELVLRRRREKTEPSRSRTALLAKNLPAETTRADLASLFSSDTSTTPPPTIHLAPSKLIAVIEFSHPNDARAALKRHAYRRFKRVPLYLDWAPVAAVPPPKQVVTTKVNPLPEEEEKDVALRSTTTVYATNLSFDATAADLEDLFRDYKVRAATIPKNKGFGFVDLASTDDARRAVDALQGATFRGRVLKLAFAATTKRKETNDDDDDDDDVQDEHERQTKATTPTQLRKRGKHPSKLVVRNLAFATTVRDLRGLFASFGELKTIRLPKRFDGRHRGFAFVEYLAHRDAASAFAALKAAHLYGRHLVIEYAAADHLGAALLDDEHTAETNA